MTGYRKNAVFRGFMFDFRSFCMQLWQFALVIALFAILWKNNDIMSPVMAVLTFSGVIGMTMSMQRYTAYYSQLVGYGLTKRNFMLAGLLAKPMYMAFGAAAMLLTALMEKTPAEEILLLTVFNAAIMLIFSSYGDLSGAMVLRWSRVGFILYMVLFIGTMFGIGVLAGIMASAGEEIMEASGVGQQMLAASLGQITLVVSIAALIVTPLFHLLAALLLRNVEVRS